MPKTICFLLLFIANLAHTQICNIPIQPGESCMDAPFFCELDGTCFRNENYNANDDPTDFCGTIENDAWLTFKPTRLII